MDVDLALLADAATIDGAGKLNILGIFDRLHTPEDGFSSSFLRSTH